MTYKPTLAGEDCEDGVWVFVELAQGSNQVGQQVAAKRVERGRAIELDDADLLRDREHDVCVLVLHCEDFVLATQASKEADLSWCP